jgi:hypothetical protein
MSSELPDVGAFAARFEDFLEAMTAAAERPEPELLGRIREHLGAEPRELPVTAAEFASTDRANLQLALDAVLAGAQLLGFSGMHVPYQLAGLPALLSGDVAFGRVKAGPVQYANVEIGDGRVIQAVANGILLAERDGAPIAMVVSTGERGFGGVALKLEGISPVAEAVQATLDDIRAAMREHNVFRGRTISLNISPPDDSVSVVFHRLPAVAREAVILPDGTLERLERHALGIAEHADRLRAAGRHLKRGILLHGPPGTGKTLSINYVLGAMPGRTTILLTGRGLGLIEPALAIARDLEPATVVFEDIDLVAAERMLDYGSSGVLFDLLNQMEGLAEDADLLFLLTSNRPDVLEPALAARPGRVDLALEIPLPDAAARARLLRLYAGGIEFDVDAAVERTESVSGAFIKELMRQAALRATLEDREPGGEDVSAVLDDLLADRSALTRRLLGQPGEDDGEGPEPPPEMLRAIEAAGLPLPPGFFSD